MTITLPANLPVNLPANLDAQMRDLPSWALNEVIVDGMLAGSRRDLSQPSKDLRVTRELAARVELIRRAKLQLRSQ